MINIKGKNGIALSVQPGDEGDFVSILHFVEDGEVVQAVARHGFKSAREAELDGIKAIDSVHEVLKLKGLVENSRLEFPVQNNERVVH